MEHTLTRAARQALILAIAVAIGLFGQVAPKKITKAEAMSSIVSKVAPEYPLMARQLKIEGQVELEVTIGESGSVEGVTIVSGNPVLTKPASEAVKKWKFSPFTQEGKPVKAVAPLTLVFKI